MSRLTTGRGSRNAVDHLDRHRSAALRQTRDRGPHAQRPRLGFFDRMELELELVSQRRGEVAGEVLLLRGLDAAVRILVSEPQRDAIHDHLVVAREVGFRVDVDELRLATATRLELRLILQEAGVADSLRSCCGREDEQPVGQDAKARKASRERARLQPRVS